MQLGHQDQNVCARAAVGVPWFLKRQQQMLQLLTHIPCCLTALYETLVGPMCWQPCLTLGAGSHKQHQGRQQPALQDTSRTSACCVSSRNPGCCMLVSYSSSRLVVPPALYLPDSKGGISEGQLRPSPCFQTWWTPLRVPHPPADLAGAQVRSGHWRGAALHSSWHLSTPLATCSDGSGAPWAWGPRVGSTQPLTNQPPCLASRQGSPAAAKQEDSSSELLCTTSCVTGNRGQRLSGLKLPQPSAAFILSTLSTK